MNPPEPAQGPAARISHLSWKTILRDLDLCVHRGERVAIIGSSGSGKSKLLECILGLRRPDAGAIELMGHAVTGRPLALEGLGVAFQEHGLFDDWTIRENLTLVRAGGEAPPPKQGFAVDGEPSPGAAGTADRADVESLLTEVGLANVLALDATPARLSGGQKKRLALLRALMRGTELLVLDEPTSGLDPQDSSGVCEFLARRLEESNRALL